ncbi:MAG: hypothetical protein AAF483_29070, partial [Planctomycetota bacterium]
RTLQPSSDSFPRALKAALMAAEAGLEVSQNIHKISNYLAGRLINGIRGREDTIEICETMLGSISLPPGLAQRLEDEAARHEFNLGNEFACIKRLERVLADNHYREYHERFRRTLDYLKQPPMDDEPSDQPKSR